jgi:hypothetical protein
MPTFTSSAYQPSRGGHAPGDLRDAFLGALQELIATPCEAPVPAADLRGKPTSLPAICRLLWNCTDTLPGHIVADLDALGFAGTGTYAAAARWLARSQVPRAARR